MSRVEIPETVTVRLGTYLAPITGARVQVNHAADDTPATVYAAKTGGTTVTNPVVTVNGRIEGYLDPGSYKLVVSGTAPQTGITPNGIDTYTQPIEILDADATIAGGSPAAAAVVVTPTGSLTGTNAQAALEALAARELAVESDNLLKLVKTANLSDLANAPTARTNLGLGTAATQATGAFDAAGAATTAVSTHAGATDPHGDRAYADTLIAAADAMVFKTVIDASANPNYPAADKGWTYRISVAGKIGGASGVNVEAGDILICLTDGTSAGTQAAVGANWSIIQTNIDGAVIGPASATDGDLARFDTTSGKLIKAGVVLDTDTTLGANSDLRVATQKAVKAAIAAATPADATTGSKGIVQLAGDLGGTAAAPTVPGKSNVTVDGVHQGTLALSSTPVTAADVGAVPVPSSPALGDMLTYNGTTWAKVGGTKATDKVAVLQSDGSVQWATQLGAGGVSDGGVTEVKLADQAVTPRKLHIASRLPGRATGVLIATMDRERASGALTLTSGTPRFSQITLPTGLVLTSLGATANSVAAASPTHQWFAITDLSGVVVYVTADDTTTAWAVNATKDLAISSGPVTVASLLEGYLVVMVSASTPPNLCTTTAPAAGILALTPFLGGNSTATGQTTPPTVGATIAIPTAGASKFYGHGK